MTGAEPAPAKAGGGRSDSQLARGLAALELLAIAPRSAADVARELEVNRSTGFRLLQDLEVLGYVRRDPETRRYGSVPERFYGLVGGENSDWDWSQTVHPVLAALRDETKEATILGVPANGSMVYLAFFPSLHPIAVRERTGSVRPMHASSLGKAYLSTLSAAQLDVELARLSYEGGTSKAAQGPIELRSRIDEVRERGYAVDRGESLEGVTCVAAPVRVAGKPVGAVSFSGPSERFDEAAIERLGTRLIEETIKLDTPYHR
jgi:IclR family acetate operon transcriptional repressor